jgi:putative PIN family toxin of toxin-antitoxin system
VKKYQVIIDTNVILSGLKSNKGASYKLLTLIESKLFELNLSVPLIFEYEFILKRYQKDLGLTIYEIDDFLNYLCLISNNHIIHFLWRPYLNDPYDDLIVELAFSCEADYIITYNSKDFNSVNKLGLKTIKPVDFLKLIGELR